MTNLSPRQQVEVWTEGRATLLHAVRFGDDSLRGTSWLTPLDSDTATVRAFDNAAIDSVRIGERGDNFVVALVSVGVAIGLAYCFLGGCNAGGT